MGRAIEAHVEEHRKKIKGKKGTGAEVDVIADELIIQALTKVCEV
jgi:hypothetical protein